MAIMTEAQTRPDDRAAHRSPNIIDDMRPEMASKWFDDVGQRCLIINLLAHDFESTESQNKV